MFGGLATILGAIGLLVAVTAPIGGGIVIAGAALIALASALAVLAYVNWNAITDGLKALGMHVMSLSEYFTSTANMAAERRKAIGDWLGHLFGQGEESPIQKQSWVPLTRRGAAPAGAHSHQSRRAQARRRRQLPRGPRHGGGGLGRTLGLPLPATGGAREEGLPIPRRESRGTEG